MELGLSEVANIRQSVGQKPVDDGAKRPGRTMYAGDERRSMERDLTRANLRDTAFREAAAHPPKNPRSSWQLRKQGTFNMRQSRDGFA